MRRVQVFLFAFLATTGLAFGQTDNQRGDNWSSRANQTMERLLGPTAFVRYPNFAADPFPCTIAKRGAFYFNTTTSTFRLCDGTAWNDIVTGAAVGGSGTLNTIPKWTPDGTTLGDSDLRNLGVPTAGTSGDVLDLTFTLNVMDGNDTVNGFRITPTNASHTSSGNTFSAFTIDSIGATTAEETAITIFGSGYNNHIDTSSSDFRWAAFDGVGAGISWSILDTDSQASVIKVEFPSLVGDLFGSIMLMGNSNLIVPSGPGGIPAFEMNSRVGIMDGSDNAVGLKLNFDTQNIFHSGASNTFTALGIDSITALANVTETGISIGSGFTVGLNIATITSFLTIEEGADTASFQLPTLTAARTYTFPDASGTVTLDGVTGSGTLNTIPLWTPDGSTLSNSNLTQTGTQVEIVADGSESTNNLTFGASEDVSIYWTEAGALFHFNIHANRTAAGGATVAITGDSPTAGSDILRLFTNDPTIANQRYRFADVPIASFGGTMFDLGAGATLNPLDAGFTTNLLQIRFVNANHAGGTVNAITGTSITGDPEAIENFFAVPDGYDNFMTVDEGVDKATFTLPALTAARTYTYPDDSVDFTTPADDDVLTYDLGTRTWSPEPAAVGGSGTTNTISKFTSATTLGDSSITDDGVTVDLTVADVSFADGSAVTFDANGSLTITAPTANASNFDFVMTIPITAAAQITNVFDFSVTNTNHTGGDVNLLNIGAITGDPDATETAINIGAGWDIVLNTAQAPTFANPTIFATDTGAGFMARSEGDLYHIVDSGNSFFWQLDIGPVTLMQIATNMIDDGGESGSLLELFAPLNSNNGMNGNDSIAIFNIDVANANHSGTNNTLDLIRIDAMTGDANSNLNAILIGALTGTTGAAGEVETAINIGAGWDNDFLGKDVVLTVRSATLPNPAANEIRFYVDESTDRVGAAAADCVYVARLSSGVEINVAILVTDGGCP